MKLRLGYRELVACVLLLLLLAAIVLPGLGRAREASRRASCQNNLKQLGIVFKMYANESRGERFPSVSRIPQNWIFDLHAVYPEYLSDFSTLVCPDNPYASAEDFTLKRNLDHPDQAPGTFHPDCVSAASYTYTGYVLTDDQQAVALFRESLRMPWAQFRDTDHTLPVPVWPDALKRPGGMPAMPMLWDRVPRTEGEFAHRPLGGNVLFPDGAVKFIPYHRYNAAYQFPMTHLTGLTFGSAVPRLSADCY